MEQEAVLTLIEQAMEARKYAYSPYSGYSVGAALLSKKGKVFWGCNIENASFGATNCAERTAFFRAVSEGEREFSAIAIVGAPTDGAKEAHFSQYAFPCGICRQVMQEFCPEDFLIIVARNTEDYQIFTLKELLPCGFGA